MELRSFQKEFLEVLRRIRSGENIRHVLIHVTPGGGKSLLALLAAHHLIQSGLIDKFCWIVPRIALAEQAEKIFHNPYWRKELGHNLSIRTAVNDINPCRGKDGYAITMAALAQDRGGINLDEFDRYRYGTFVDEDHHVSADPSRGYHRGLVPVIQKSHYTFFATGSLGRHRSNGESGRIFGWEYKETPSGLFVPNFDLDQSSGKFTIIYGREQALREHAIIPVHVKYHDAQAEWISPNGVLKECKSFDSADSEEERAMRKVVLKTEFALQLIDKAIDHWVAYCKQVYPGSKLLVVAPFQKEAKQYLDHVRSKGIHAVLAISDEDDARKAIRSFRDSGAGGPNCLVTVAMAYEGLDVPEITHIVALTDYRSKSWVEQMIARSTRYNPNAGPYEKQQAYLYAPNDGSMRAIVEQIKAEQAPVVGDVPDELALPDRDTGLSNGIFDFNDGPRPDLVPKSSILTRARAIDLDGECQTTTYEEEHRIQAILAKSGMTGTTTQFKTAMAMYNGDIEVEIPDSQPTVPFIADQVARKRILTAINDLCTSADRLHGRSFGTTNKEVYKKFNKSREDMDYSELVECWKWVANRYPSRNRAQ